MSGAIRLHLGCGLNKISGWVNIDSVSNCQPDLVHDLSKPLPYADLSVDEILAEDLLEHFDKYMRFLVFGEWARVLKVSGRMTVQVPNFEKILFRYFKFGFDNFVDFIFGENMLRSEVYIGHFGNHKWGYSQKSLCEFVRHFGMEPVSIKKEGLNLRLVAEKRQHVSVAELDKIMIYSHANAHGIGQARMSLGQVREKIKVFKNNS
ncbi:MAG TPA: methyltransferase domain-containing protein [Candidatus Omnitrophota bacterium]|nr:methyltransferase domain-containing protein [Candidatus Omnitrophota bacterium]HPD84966.1 methyltransferase domain-containing protein [Candidatus Omnitrophota bacterium]HRZ03824.1 methyltransferase domain-containing protein [Candidatus Omnitrophota bacterium]